MEKKQQNTVIRFIIIFGVMLFGFVVVVGQIIFIQTKERRKWLAIADKQEKVRKEIPPMRGNIFDATGRLLAGSLPRYELVMDMRVPALHAGGDTLFLKNLDNVADNLAQIFQDKSADEYKRVMLREFQRKNGRWKLQPGAVSYTQMKRVKAIPLYRLGQYKSGLIINPRHVRVKPFGSLASRTVGGIYGEKGEGINGLEKQYDRLLHGKPGVSEQTRERVLAMAQKLGYKTVFWSLAYVDWLQNKQPTAEEAFSKLIPRIHGGAVVLLHSTSKTNAAILDSLLTRWEDLGYRFGTLDELFAAKP